MSLHDRHYIREPQTKPDALTRLLRRIIDWLRPASADERRIKRNQASLVEQQKQARIDAAQVDHILAKIKSRGLQTLTTTERQTLARATSRARQ